MSEAEGGTSSLFFELAGDLRLSMLEKLKNEKKYRLSQLASDLDATMQEAHRNISRLIDSGMISKDGEGEISLTPYGKIIVNLIPNYEFLIMHKDYFLDHSLGDLPIKFVQRIGSLKNSEIIVGVMAILQRWKILYSNSNLYIKEIMAQVPLDLIETLHHKIDNGIKFSYIFSSDAVIPKGRSELLEKIGWRNFISKGLVERKMTNKVKIMTIINEIESCLIFPNLKGDPDLNVMFYSRDTEFHEWCNDLFEYYWGIAGPFDEGKLKKET